MILSVVWEPSWLAWQDGFVGGFLGRLIFGGSGDRLDPAGLVGSVIGGILVMVLMRRIAPRNPS